MDATLTKALVALAPASILFVGSAIIFFREKAVNGLLQVVGAGSLVVVALTHICEALHLFPLMHWGLEHSSGHYIDLSSAILGVTLFPLGYFFQALTNRQARTVSMGR